MDDLERHEMQLAATYPTGIEEWYCPTCNRRILMQWPPDYKKVVLESGDEYALHSGGKDGLRLGSVQVSNDEETESSEELELGSWEDWLSDVDLNGSRAQ